MDTPPNEDLAPAPRPTPLRIRRVYDLTADPPRQGPDRALDPPALCRRRADRAPTPTGSRSNGHEHGWEHLSVIGERLGAEAPTSPRHSPPAPGRYPNVPGEELAQTISL